jgi:hypothetical protein
LVAAARHGLGDRAAPVVIEAAASERVLARARFDRITGFLVAAVRAGVVTAEDDALAWSLEEQWRGELLTCVRLEGLAVRTGKMLDDAGITWRLTKGPALAHRDYPDPAIRTFGDLDLVVHPSDWSRAFDLLSSCGYRRQAPTLTGGYDARYGKGATLTGPDGLEVDLHRRFAVGRFAVTARMEAVFESAEAIGLAGRTIPVFDPTGRLLHACFHATLGGFRRLRAFRDVAQLILVTGADWQATFAIARSWRAEAVVASAIMETWERLGLGVVHPARTMATSIPVSRADRRVLELFAREAPFRAQALTALRRMPPYQVPRYLWSLSRPTLRRRG